MLNLYIGLLYIAIILYICSAILQLYLKFWLMKQKEELILKRVLSDMRECAFTCRSVNSEDVFLWYERLRSLVVNNPLTIAFDDYGKRI